MSEVILSEVKGGVATVTMNRPTALNALNDELTQALRTVTADLEYDESVRVVVLRGGDHFMAGGDLKEFHRGVGDGAVELRIRFERMIHEIHEAITAIRRMPKPVVASVNGAAAGFGLSLMMACDLVMAADSAYFTLAYCHIGATPDGGSTYALPRALGMKRAMEIALLGERFDAARALDLGLVNWVVPADRLDAETAKFAARLAAGPTRVYGRTKALLLASPQNNLETQLQREAEMFAMTATEPDFAEGLTAFVEKRKPNFKG